MEEKATPKKRTTRAKKAKITKETNEINEIKEVVEEVKIVQPKPDQKDIEIENLKAQIEQLKQLMLQRSQPQQVFVTSNDSERVWFLWLADVADDNLLLIGESGQYGRIIGKTGSFYVPKNDLSRILDSAVRGYLERRWMIVISGLNDDEREALGVNYKEGEILDEKMFARLTEMGKELLPVFDGLCNPHKEMVASRFHEAYESGKKLDRQLIVDLNKLYPNEGFKDIIEKMNAKDLG